MRRKPIGFERLDERTLLAVLSVAPQAGDNAASLLADAIATANSTPEPDTIELAPADYDLSTLSAPSADEAVLEITSEISIIGTSPSTTAIIPRTGYAVFAVRSDASLSLSLLTVYGSMQPRNEALVPLHAIHVDVGASAQLDQVALIGLIDPEQSSTTVQTSLIENAGTLTVNRSVLIDSSGSAVNTRNASTSIMNTTIAGASVVGLASFSGIEETDATGSLLIDGSLLFRNGLGVFSIHDTSVSGSTITQNGRGDIGLLNGGFLGVARGENPPKFDFDSDNVIAGNFIHENRSDLIILARDNLVDPLESIGTSEMATQNLESVVAVIDEGLLLTNESLEGVNVDVVPADNHTFVQSRGLGVSSVFWNPQTSRFLVDVAVPPLRSQPTRANELVTLDAGRIVGGGLSVSLTINSLFATTGGVTAAQRAAWEQAVLHSVESESGAEVGIQRDGEGRLIGFQYQSIEGFAGNDTLTVVGEDEDGNRLESSIMLGVAEQADVKFNIAAAELNDVIEVALSSSGFARVSQFDFVFSFDPTVVRLVGNEFGRGYPFLQKFDVDGGVVSLGAFNGFSTGNDLLTLTFERIADGPANVELTTSVFTQAGSTQRLPLGAANQQYYFLAQDDTNRDGDVSPSDALRVINRLGNVQESNRSASYDRELDTNGDSKVSPSDALRIINRIAKAASVESQQAPIAHAVFSPNALQFLSLDETIPTFVARPNLPLDDGTPAHFVDTTPPTQQELDNAFLIAPGPEGFSMRSGLQSVEEQVIYAVTPSTDRLAFGLIASEGGSSSDLSLTLWNAEGILLDAYPTEASSGFPGGAVDATPGEPIFFRIGSSNEESLSYVFDVLSLT